MILSTTFTFIRPKATGHLSELETMRCIKIDMRTSMDVYSLEMVIDLSYRVNSIKADIFRKYLASRLQ